jgi:tRNA (guanosine-2'-O-)-methyltransferase
MSAQGTEPPVRHDASDGGRTSGSPPRRLARAEAVLAARRRSLCIVLEDAHDPHNVSAVLRTSEALGVQDVHLVAELEDETILNPKVTIGSHRWLTVHRHRGTRGAIDALRAAGYRIYVSHLDPRARYLTDLPAGDRSAYVFGNERSGVTDLWLGAADATFLIPTSGFSGSLNLSVAVAITIWDRLMGRPGARLPPGDLDGEAQAALRAAWYRELARGNAARRDEYASWLEHPAPPRPAFGFDRRLGPPPAPGDADEPS